MSEEVMTAKEAAAFLKLSRDSLYAAANRGDIPHRRVGRRMLFSSVALLAWLRGDSLASNDDVSTRSVAA